jgi:outer membrane immunogenic protein
MAVAPAYAWTGWYVGFNAGGVWSDPSGFVTDVTSCTLAGSCAAGRVLSVPASLALASSLGTGSNRRSGFIGGGQVGYNWQAQNWLLGIEGDLEYFDARSSLSEPELSRPAIQLQFQTP